MNVELDSFESQLLGELRQHVADRAAGGHGLKDCQRHHSRARLALFVVAAAVVIAAVLVVPGLGSSPAYSVGQGNAGEIRVEINRPEDADGLEEALADHGIAADITYLSGLQVCAPGRYTALDRELAGMTTSVGESRISVTLPPGTVREGETFVLVWSVVPMTAKGLDEPTTESGSESVSGFSSSLDFDVASGPVAPCEPVAAHG